MGTCVTQLRRRSTHRLTESCYTERQSPPPSSAVAPGLLVVGRRSSSSSSSNRRVVSKKDNEQDSRQQQSVDEWHQYSDCLRSYVSSTSSNRGGGFDPYSMYHLHGSYVVDIEWSFYGDGSSSSIGDGGSKKNPVVLLRLLPKWVQSAMMSSQVLSINDDDFYSSSSSISNKGGGGGICITEDDASFALPAATHPIAIITLVIRFKKIAHGSTGGINASPAFDDLMEQCRNAYVVGIFFPTKKGKTHAMRGEKHNNRSSSSSSSSGAGRIRSSHSKVSVPSATMTFASIGRQQGDDRGGATRSLAHLGSGGGSGVPTTFLFSIVFQRAEFYTYHMTVKNKLAPQLMSKYAPSSSTM